MVQVLPEKHFATSTHRHIEIHKMKIMPARVSRLATTHCYILDLNWAGFSSGTSTFHCHQGTPSLTDLSLTMYVILYLNNSAKVLKHIFKQTIGFNSDVNNAVCMKYGLPVGLSKSHLTYPLTVFSFR